MTSDPEVRQREMIERYFGSASRDIASFDNPQTEEILARLDAERRSEDAQMLEVRIREAVLRGDLKTAQRLEDERALEDLKVRLTVGHEADREARKLRAALHRVHRKGLSPDRPGFPWPATDFSHHLIKSVREWRAR